MNTHTNSNSNSNSNSTHNNNDFLTSALEYLSLDGYSVFPCSTAKTPLISQWKECQTRKPTEEEIHAWAAQFPNACVAIVTGKISGITVVDIDAYKPNAVSPAIFPTTRTVRTGNGGQHLIYQYHPGLSISANSYPQYPHLDIRSDGGYIIAAGSTTSYTKDNIPQGGLYEVEKELPPSPFPHHLFTASNSKPKKTLATTVGVQNGSRNDSIASVIGKLLLASKESSWLTEVLPAVEKINETYKPPLPLSELHATFNSIASIERGRKAAISKQDGVDPTSPDYASEDEVRQEFAKDKTNGTFALAHFLVNKYSIITVGEKEREIYVYRDGIYFQAENEIIFPEVQRILGSAVTKNAKMETYHKVADMTTKPREVFTSAALNFIPLENGVYDTNTKTLLPHDQKFLFTYKLPIIFDSQATCPKISAFLDDVLLPEQRTTMEEWLGYYFYRNYMFKKAIICVGGGDTGKTTLLEVIDFLLGKKNISSVSLQKLTTDKFSAAQLYAKHGNLVDELSAADITDTGNFKIATGGGSISGEYKFGNQFLFNNFSKLTFACNKIPDVADFDDEAYFNRWMVIRFQKTIVKKIPNFIKTITTEEERSGLFNLAMVGLERLLTNGKFSYSLTAIDTKREMMRGGSSIACFASDMIEKDLGAEMSKEDMYDAYCDFCSENDLAADTIKMLGTKLPFYVTFLSEGSMTVRKGTGFERVRCWRNVKIATPTPQAPQPTHVTPQEAADWAAQAGF